MRGKDLKCSICGHEWISKLAGDPIKCPNPKCQSPDWNVGQAPTNKEQEKEEQGISNPEDF